MVEIVAFAIPLHHVGAFFVVNVPHRTARVGGDTFAVEPADVGSSDGVFGQGAEMGEVEGFGGEAGTVAEDAPACWGAEHGVAEAVDEVRGGGCFGEDGDEVCRQYKRTVVSQG